MKIDTTGTIIVSIEPKAVIKKLLEKTGTPELLIENGRFYRLDEVSHGSHSVEVKEEISRREFEYIHALITILNYENDKNR